jgi:hypothetical protein
MRRIVASVDDWANLIEQLKADLNEDEETDPIYEQTEGGVMLTEVCEEVEEKMGIWLEQSIQFGFGEMAIFNEDDDLVASCDYQSFNSTVINLALKSKSESSFKKQYKNFLLSLMDEYASENKD